MESVLWAELARQQINEVAGVVRTFVPYAENGYAQLVAATLEPALSLDGKFSTSIENVPDLSGAIAIEIVGNSAGKPATLLLAGSGLLTLNRHTKVCKRLVPVFQVCVGPNVYVLSRAAQLASVNELVAAVRERPGYFSFASPGLGSGQYALGKAFALALGLSLQHSRAASFSEMYKSVSAGDVLLLCDFIGDLLPLIHQGHVVPVAVSGKARNSALPHVPTVSELSLPECDVDHWLGYFTSSNTNEHIVDELAVALRTALESPSVRDRLTLSGAITVEGSRQTLSTVSASASWPS